MTIKWLKPPLIYFIHSLTQPEVAKQQQQKKITNLTNADDKFLVVPIGNGFMHYFKLCEQNKNCQFCLAWPGCFQ